MDLRRAEELTDKFPMFFKTRREGVTLFSYHWVNPTVYDSFPSTRELRGLIFDERGNIIARPFPKFFNYGEKNCVVEEGDIVTVNLKLDGSLVIPYRHKHKICFASKGSLDSWVTKIAQQIITKNQKKLINALIRVDYTPQFELLSPDAQSVIKHKKNKLVFIGARNIRTGEILPISQIEHLGELYKVDFVPVIYRNKPIEEVYKIIKESKDEEGVVGYPDLYPSELVKIKSTWYVGLHRLVTEFTEKRIKAYFGSGRLDDVYSRVPEDLKGEVDKVVNHCTERVQRKIEKIKKYFKENSFRNRGELGMAVTYDPDINKAEQWIYFEVWKQGEEITDEKIKKAVWDYFKDHWTRGVKL